MEFPLCVCVHVCVCVCACACVCASFPFCFEDMCFFPFWYAGKIWDLINS